MLIPFLSEICMRTLIGKLSARTSYLAIALVLLTFRLSTVDARLSSFSFFFLFLFRHNQGYARLTGC